MVRKTVPVRYGKDGPIIGEAEVDDDGAFTMDLSGIHAADLTDHSPP